MYFSKYFIDCFIDGREKIEIDSLSTFQFLKTKNAMFRDAITMDQNMCSFENIIIKYRKPNSKDYKNHNE